MITRRQTFKSKVLKKNYSFHSLFSYRKSSFLHLASTKFILNLSSPDFMSYTIEDPFRLLGPIAIFSAHRHWTAPRTIRLQKDPFKEHTHGNRRRYCSHYENSANEIELECNTNHDVEGYGFHLHGSAPVMISHIYINSMADVSGGVSYNQFHIYIAIFFFCDICSWLE